MSKVDEWANTEAIRISIKNLHFDACFKEMQLLAEQASTKLGGRFKPDLMQCLIAAKIAQKDPKYSLSLVPPG